MPNPKTLEALQSIIEAFGFDVRTGRAMASQLDPERSPHHVAVWSDGASSPNDIPVLVVSKTTDFPADPDAMFEGPA